MVKHDNKASPPVKVVGFRVEGATPSPGESSLAEAAQANTSTGSPSPVIIPPAFAGQGRASGGDATPTMQPALSPAGLASGGGSFQLDLREGEDAGSGGLPPIRTEPQGLDPDAFARDRTPTKASVVSPTGRPLPLTPVGASAPADLGRQFAAAVGSPTSAPSSIPEQAAVVLAAATISAAIAPPPPASATLVRQQAAAALPEPPLAAAGRAAAAGPPAAAEGPARGGGGSGDGAPAPAPAARKGQKEMSKAERRAVQEAQRAAKAAAKAGQGGSGTAATGGGPAGGKEQGKAVTKQGSGSNLAQQGTVTRQPSGAQQDGKTTAESAAAARAARQQQGSSQGGGKAGASPRADVGVVVRAKSAEMFAHLPQPKGITLATVAEQKGPTVPLAAVKLGLRYADGSVRGGNARCIAMLQMMVECIQDFHTPPGREFAKEFAPALNNIINFLVSCRPLSVSMGNAIKSIKGWLEKMKVQPQPNEQQAKDVLVEQLTEYLEQKIGFADRMLVKHAIAKIKDGDTIMTYAYSSVVAATLLAAHRAGKQFDVVVVDSRPLLEGRRMLTTLLEAGVTCEYCHLGALSYEMTEVDKVFLGAASVLSNGAVLSRVGTAAVALMAAAQRVPVLVCCETYKFHERVQLDSITNNELMDKAGLAHVQDRPDVAPLQGWEQEDKVHLLNLAYDLTPADFVTVVVTEMGAVPPTSVAVILREAQRDIGMM